MWDLAEGRSVVTDSILTESVGFCQCSLLDREGGHWLLAVPGADMAAVRAMQHRRYRGDVIPTMREREDKARDYPLHQT